MSLEKKGHLLGKTHPLIPQGAVPDPVEIIRTGKGAAAGGGGRVGELN